MEAWFICVRQHELHILACLSYIYTHQRDLKVTSTVCKVFMVPCYAISCQPFWVPVTVYPSSGKQAPVPVECTLACLSASALRYFHLVCSSPFWIIPFGHKFLHLISEDYFLHASLTSFHGLCWTLEGTSEPQALPLFLVRLTIWIKISGHCGSLYPISEDYLLHF